MRKVTKGNLINQLIVCARAAIETDHLKTTSISNEQQNQVLSFIIDTMNYIEKINNIYINLLKLCYREKIDNKNYFYFSLHEGIDKNKSNKIYIGDYADSLFDRIKEQKALKGIPLDDPEYIQNYLDVDYRVFYAFLSQMLNLTAEEFIRSGIEGKIVMKNNPFEITKVNIFYLEE